MADNCLLYLLLLKIAHYEPGLYEHIKSQFFYKFKDTLEFKIAVNQ